MIGDPNPSTRGGLEEPPTPTATANGVGARRTKRNTPGVGPGVWAGRPRDQPSGFASVSVFSSVSVFASASFFASVSFFASDFGLALVGVDS